MKFIHQNAECEYNVENETLYYFRGCGIGSNINVILNLLLNLNLKNIYPKKIVTKLENFKNMDGFKFFNTNLNRYDEWKDYNKIEISNAINRLQPNETHSLGYNRDHVDFKIIKLLLDIYFNLSNEVLKESENIKNKYNLKDYNFIYLRKTDKVREVHGDYPTVDDALKLIDNNFTTVAQTDDLNVFNQFKQYNQITQLNELPLTEGIGFHDLSMRMSNEEFVERYKFEYEKYLLKLLSVVHLASKSVKFVGGPGNLSLFTIFLRNSFNNAYFMVSKNKFY